MKWGKNIGRLVLLLAASGAYLYAFPSATIAFFCILLFHVAAGLALAVLLIGLLIRGLRDESWRQRLAWYVIAAGAAAGVALLYTGGSRRFQPWIDTHTLLSAFGCFLLLSNWAGARAMVGRRRGAPAMRVVVSFLAVVLVCFGAWWVRENYWQSAYRIRNPPLPPASMEGEGGGPQGPFFPSSAVTLGGGRIPAKFFMQSDQCARCHADIYNQWSSSAHHFSSFNNQWYRKSIEYMQDVAGVKPSKWCAGCHDPALLFSGQFDTPVRDRVNTPEAQAGLGCVMCHSIVAVKSTMGQGDYVLEYPALHELATSENRWIRAVHDLLIRINPEPHRRTFLKPFVRNQTADFCSTCHKVHLDVPVNHYRWVRGFNDYDNWQASGVSGQGARSFYYPAKSSKCVDCHMPLTPSRDQGNVNGFVHSHRFPGANTALPVANQDAPQLEAVQKFLRDKIVSVDIFALSRAAARLSGDAGAGNETMTTFAVGEEAETLVPKASQEMELAVTGPLNRVKGLVRRGEAVRVDVVVRTRKVGHFFPAGTVDAFDVWLELKATDNRGRVLFWSGVAADDGRGPVDPGAHFYRSLAVDARGNPINKRNAWATRALVYAHLVPPGAADVAHYRLRVPEDAGEELRIEVRLHYRKFAWWHTQFAYAGVRDTASAQRDVTPDYDDGKWSFTGETKNVSGQLKQIPELPIVTLASDAVTLHVLPRSAAPPEPQRLLDPADWERWNDYGIGLLLQGDLKGAETAFLQAAEIQPANPDGWVNIGRARVQEGNLAGAREALERALGQAPKLARAHFFYARILKAEGRYDEAAAHLRIVLDQYPRDRVARNDLGRLLFLQKNYRQAAREFEQTLAVDPEDLQAHYNLMLCYNGLGYGARAEEHRKRYLRFKADEAAQAITGPYRSAHPEDNNERQAIHEHESAPLGRVRAYSAGAHPGVATPARARNSARTSD